VMWLGVNRAQFIVPAKSTEKDRNEGAVV